MSLWLLSDEDPIFDAPRPEGNCVGLTPEAPQAAIGLARAASADRVTAGADALFTGPGSPRQNVRMGREAGAALCGFGRCLGE